MANNINYRKIRNINKKLTLMHKVDKAIEENPGKTLDELVSLKIINTDQKQQAINKPGLQQQVATFEEQLSHYKKFDDEYKQSMAKERELLQSSHSKELEEMKEVVTREAKIEAELEFKRKLLTFTRFLKAAAGRRQNEDQTDDGKAFEGVLCGVYTGDAAAVDCAEKLVNGSDEKVPEYSGPVDITCEFHQSSLCCDRFRSCHFLREHLD